MARHKVFNLIAAIVLIIAAIIASFSGAGYNAFAATTDYSSVLTDLRTDKSFNLNDYPDDSKDYSLQVIQVAESRNGELLLYVYQPAAKTRFLEATQINMSLSKEVTGTKLYNLTFLTCTGVLQKYRVNDVTVSSDTTRYYNITSIYRPWNENLDGKPANDNTVNAKSFAVRSIYRITTDSDGKLQYYCEPTYTVTILNPYVGLLTYVENFPTNAGFTVNTNWKALDSHYIAFSTDWEIDRLKSVDVSYIERKAHFTTKNLWQWIPLGDELTYEPEQPKTITPTYKSRYKNDGYKLGQKYTYAWDRIQRTQDFIKNEEYLTDDTKKTLQAEQWIIRFTETERKQQNVDVMGYSQIQVDFTDISSVTIIRLEFETNSITYNLGAVSNIQTGSGAPGNMDKDPGFDFFEWLESITGMPKGAWIAILVGIVVLIFLPVLCILLPPVGKLLIFLLKAVIWIISAPFRLIAFIARRVSERKEVAPTKAEKSYGEKIKKKRR